MDMRNYKGFTLIEILVVISVIAILVGIVVPRFKGIQSEANRAKVKAELKTLQTAVESYYMHQDPQQYPPPTTTLCHDYLIGANPRIVSSILYDPFATPGTEYFYEVSPNGSYYVITSIGENNTIDITGIGDDGILIGADVDDVDDIYVTNGIGWS
jgi:general secretion pathway protein G